MSPPDAAHADLPPADPPAAWRALAATAVAPRGPWARLDVVDRTGSTNADLAAAAARGAAEAPDRSVLLTHHQVAGRGRHDRGWEARPAEGLTLSVLLRPAGVPLSAWGWAPLMAGVALVLTLEDDGVPVALKWPNDLLLGGPPTDPGKAAGVLCEVVDGGADGPALVLGIGLNVTTARADLPAGATSLAAEGVARGRVDVLGDLLAVLASLDEDWRAAGGDAGASGLAAAYREACATVGRRVAVALPGGRELHGDAADVDDEGRLLVVDDAGAATAVSAGDVVHVRPGAGPGPSAGPGDGAAAPPDAGRR